MLLYQSVADIHTTPPPDRVVYVGNSLLIWIFSAVYNKTDWPQFYGSAAIAATFEVVLVALTASLEKSVHWSISDGLLLAIQSARVASLMVLCLVAFLIHHKHVQEPDEEYEPLLSGIEEDVDNDAVKGQNKQEDKDDRDAYIKRKLQDRLEEEGGYWAYVRSFKVFLPYLIPTGDHLVQLCLAIKILCIILTRFLTVLYPRQFGIVTNKLASAEGSGMVPYRELLIWMVLYVLKSRTGIPFLESMVEIPVSQFSYRRLTQAALDHVLSLSMDFHDDKDSGEVMKAVSQGRAIRDLFQTFVDVLIPSLIDIVVAFAYLYIIFGTYVSYIVFVASVFYIWGTSSSTNWSAPTRKAVIKASREEYKTMNRAMTQWQTVAHFAREAYESNRLAEKIREFQSSRAWFYIQFHVGFAVVDVIVLVTTFALALIASFRISRGEMPVGDFVFLMDYLGALIYPLYQLATQYRQLVSNLIDAERLMILFNTKPTVKDEPNAPDLVVHSGEVVFKDVGFSYDPRRKCLADINIHAQPGHTVALVGETGSGKSSLIKLLCRFYDVEDGSIQIDSQDLRKCAQRSIRNLIGIVPQNPDLFNISIMENLKYARLDATDEEVYEACKAAAIHEKILTFPDKYQSTVGERGVKVSGGELQRIAIARALLKDPPIVILDEATSSVDTETEEKIRKSFEVLSHGRTTFVIAHRLSTIVHADQILVVQDGRIIERGNHQSLLKERGKYHTLWSKQINEFEETKSAEDKNTVADNGAATDRTT